VAGIFERFGNLDEVERRYNKGIILSVVGEMTEESE
jgi:hypothetical protein